MFTQRHYNKIAEVINSQLELHHYRTSDEVKGIMDVAYSLSTVFGQDNPRFKSAVFIAACGIFEEVT